MPEPSRVQRWREGKRQHGLKAVTIWLTAEEELRLKDLALQWHCSPSAVMQRALAQVSTSLPQGNSSPPAMAQIRELISAALDARQAGQTSVTDTVTEIVTAALARDLPALVREIVEGLVLEALVSPVTDMCGDATDTNDGSTDTDSDVTDTEALGLPVTDADYGNVTDRTIADEEGETPASRQVRGPRGEMRQRILTLLGEHPEGLSTEEIRVYLKPEKPLGDTLQGMRKQQQVRTQGTGKALRYFAP